jgi:hypothetical protein
MIFIVPPQKPQPGAPPPPPFATIMLYVAVFFATMVLAVGAANWLGHLHA